MLPASAGQSGICMEGLLIVTLVPLSSQRRGECARAKEGGEGREGGEGGGEELSGNDAFVGK